MPCQLYRRFIFLLYFYYFSYSVVLVSLQFNKIKSLWECGAIEMDFVVSFCIGSFLGNMGNLPTA